MRYAVGALAVITVLAGCDDDGDSAKAKCKRLVNTFCESVTSCAEDADLLADGYEPEDLLEDCKDTVGDGAHCEDAIGVTSRYDRCLNAAGDGLSCRESNQSLLEDESFAVPDVCEGVIQFD